MNVDFLTEFDERLKKCWVYEKHPQLLPFVGENYGNGKCKRILLIGESHYISNTYLAGENKGKDRKKEELEYIFENWYGISGNDLSKDDREWTTTRDTIRTGFSTNGARFNKNIYAVLEKLGIDLSYISFMNFFQRPAYYKQSIEHSKKDIEIANETLRLVCDVIQPDCLLFVSKKAYRNWLSDKNKEIFHDAVSHPACAWWYRSGGKHGEQKFIKFFQNNVIKEAQK